MTFAQILLFITAAFTLQSAGVLLQARRQPSSRSARRVRQYLPLLLIAGLFLVGGTILQWWFEAVRWTQLHQQGLVPLTPPLVSAWLSVLVALYLIGAAIYALSQAVLFVRADSIHRHQA